MEKGILNDKCNRSACQKPGEVFSNHATRSYYCGECADLINRVNLESKRIFGHYLCTIDKIPTETPLQLEEVIYTMTEDGYSKADIEKKISEIKIHRQQRN